MREFSVTVRIPSAAFIVLAFGLFAGRAAAQSFAVNLPSQPLAASLREIGRQGGANILFDTRVAAGKTSPAIAGSLELDDALRRILAGSGLTFRHLDERTVYIEQIPRVPSAPRRRPPPPARAPPPVVVEAPNTWVDQLVVTGSSIKSRPSLSHVFTIDREVFLQSGVQTLQQVLVSQPQVTGFGASGQGGAGSGDGSGTYAPTIHSLGASSSNGTLVLINGHRVPLTGINHALVDPNIVPPAALQRVEILADGSSATYGSDAVAGVLNFITREPFKGFEASSQVGFGANYSTRALDGVAGTLWPGGGLLLAYGHSRRSALAAKDRRFVASDLTSRGGGNFATFNCAPASVQTDGAIYLFPYLAENRASASSGVCSTLPVTDILPREARDSLFAHLEQTFGSGVETSFETIWSERRNRQRVSRGSATAAVFGPGSQPQTRLGQIHPFFDGPAGAVTETVRFSADDLLGPGAMAQSGAISQSLTFALKAPVAGDWSAEMVTTVGRDTSFQSTSGSLCANCAVLALNGTVRPAGTANAANGLIFSRDLTPANALDVWRPRSANRTSAAVLSELVDIPVSSRSEQTLVDAKFTANGPLFRLPAGRVTAALGVELARYAIGQDNVSSGSTSGNLYSAQTRSLDYSRNVVAAFGEIRVPVVSPSSEFRFVRSLDLSLAARYDRYDDFGGTTNPKVTLSWQVAAPLRLRASYGTSFTAPALTSRGGEGNINGESFYGGYTTAQVVPLSFPGATALPSCNSTGCTIGSLTPGVRISGGAPLAPQTGRTGSIGVDFSSTRRGIDVSVTYWWATYRDLITVPAFSTVVNTPSLQRLLTINPTAEQIQAAIKGRTIDTPIPDVVYFLYDQTQQNAFNLRASGIDASLKHLAATGAGVFDIGIDVSAKLGFQQQAGADAPWIERVSTSGVNTTFTTNGFAARLTAGWRRDAWSARLSANIIGAYTNLNGQAPFPVVTSGSVVSGGQSVSGWTTVDAYVSRSLGAGTEVFAAASNLFDRPPPFVNTNGGYSGADSSPIGRLVTLGLRGHW